MFQYCILSISTNIILEAIKQLCDPNLFIFNRNFNITYYNPTNVMVKMN